ncbi:hypothetical protein BDP27DRAFT_164730 [Rhodocollybia butyracea]|uniref:Uncharacterized protein n=1 Tax=Rhodocollybia butyracea TaxID=206335 RepID=A0A9P5U276_9AGAR|nr:hypothetical protein BDP27DRAFT_164730 [Rhodocollybia butyracea]
MHGLRNEMEKRNNDDVPKVLGYSSADQRRSALVHAFSRNTQWAQGWIWDEGKKRFVGNPAQSIKLQRYLINLYCEKTESGECSTSSRGMTAYNMRKLRAKTVEYIQKKKKANLKGCLDSSDWGGVLKRMEHWTINLISYRCLLRTCNVVDLTVDDLDFTPLFNDETHIGITPVKCKTHQVGSLHSIFYTETDEQMMDFCVVRCLRAWLLISGIRKGYLLPKIYGHNQMQSSDEHIIRKSFLDNFRDALREIGEPPRIYTNQVFW